MTLPPPDWHLILEFTKALAGPVATLTGALVVARLALSNFRAQKAIERRLDWHEKVHRALHATADASPRAAVAQKLQDPSTGALWATAHSEARRLGELCGECWLYARQSGFAAIDKLQRELGKAHMDSKADPHKLAERVNAVCMTAASQLSTDLRGALWLRPARLRHTIGYPARARLCARS